MVHCATQHGMAEPEIADAWREREALTGGTFWLGGIDPKLERGHRFMDEEQAWFDCQDQMVVEGREGPSDVVDTMLVDPELI